MRYAMMLGAAVVLAGMAGAPAQADVVFSFGPVTAVSDPSSTGAPGGTTTVSGSLVITDEAYASGYTLRYESRAGIKGPDSLGGLRNLMVQSIATVDLDELLFLPDPLYYGAFQFRSSVEVTALPNSAPTGTIYIRSADVLVSLVFSGSNVSGGVALIGTGMCYNAGCQFTAPLVQSVPEPASAALFGAGLLGLGLTRRLTSRSRS